MTFKIDTEYNVIELTRPASMEVLEWVRESFGDGSDGRWVYGLNKFFFARQSDHLMFILKWS